MVVSPRNNPENEKSATCGRFFSKWHLLEDSGLRVDTVLLKEGLVVFNTDFWVIQLSQGEANKWVRIVRG